MLPYLLPLPPPSSPCLLLPMDLKHTYSPQLQQLKRQSVQKKPPYIIWTWRKCFKRNIHDFPTTAATCENSPVCQRLEKILNWKVCLDMHSSPFLQHHNVTVHKCTNNCRDSPPWFHCLALSYCLRGQMMQPRQ
jgi:hypothetical protein